MAAPTYNELLIRYQVKSSEMTATIQDPELKKISSELDQWETLGLSLGLGKPDIESIKRCRQKEEYKRKKMLRRWKRKYKDAATYEELARTMLQISRADLAAMVVQARKSLTEVCAYATTTDATLSPSEFTPRNSEVPQVVPTCIIKDTCGWIEIDNSIDIHWNRAVRLRRAELTTEESGSLRMNLDFAPSNTKDTEVMVKVFSSHMLATVETRLPVSEPSWALRICHGFSYITEYVWTAVKMRCSSLCPNIPGYLIKHADLQRITMTKTS